MMKTSFIYFDVFMEEHVRFCDQHFPSILIVVTVFFCFFF